MKKIAIVDDENDINELIEHYLGRRNNFDIKTYDNPKEALVPILDSAFDLVILDINMPHKNGIEILKEIKEKNIKTKVIMMTADSTLEKVIECKKIGASDYLTKPFISLRDVENKVLDNLN
mgnify:CR=1 FL=1